MYDTFIVCFFINMWSNRWLYCYKTLSDVSVSPLYWFGSLVSQDDLLANGAKLIYFSLAWISSYLLKHSYWYEMNRHVIKLTLIYVCSWQPLHNKCLCYAKAILNEIILNSFKFILWDCTWISNCLRCKALWTYV